MKKTILATIIAVFLIFEGSGCGMIKPVSAQEKILSVMKEKYGEEFEFEGWAHKQYGSRDMTANVTCASFPGERIQAGQEENEEGKMIYFDDYMAYQNEKEMQTILENLVQEVYPTAHVIWKINSSEFPKEMSREMSVQEIMESKDSVFSAYIVVNQAVNEEEKYYDLEKLRKVLEDNKIRMSVALFFTLDEEAYQTVDGENYSYWASRDGWFEQRCDFATDRAYEFYYADWR